MAPKEILGVCGMIEQVFTGFDNGALLLIVVLVPAILFAYVKGYFKEF